MRLSILIWITSVSSLFSQGLTFEPYGDSIKIVAPFEYTATTTPYYYKYDWHWGVTIDGKYRESNNSIFFRTGIGNYKIKNYIVLPKRPEWITVEISKQWETYEFPLGDTLIRIENKPLRKLPKLNSRVKGQ